MHKIMILNLGSTSTKISLYEDERMYAEQTFRNSDEEMAGHPRQRDQIALRKGQVEEWIKENKLDLDAVDALVLRVRGTDRCTKSGTYQIGEGLRKDILAHYSPEDTKFPHAACMTLPLAEELFAGRDVPMFIVDPVTVDEFTDVARLSGCKEVPRESTFHALNQKAVAREAAKQLGKPYDSIKLVVAHLGGGVSIGAHDCGRVVDSSNCASGNNGPFSPNRAGDVPAWALAKKIFTQKLSMDEVIKMLFVKGGFASYTGLTDVRLIEQKAAQGDPDCELAMQAFTYQAAKEIAAQCAVLHCSLVDAIVITGGMAYSERIVSDIKKRVGTIAPVLVFPGEEEGKAMVEGALRVLRGEEKRMII